jgi:hypothetical protein
LGLADRLLTREETDIYGVPEPAYALARGEGEEIALSVLNDQWPDWKDPAAPPPTIAGFSTTESYFCQGVGLWKPEALAESVHNGIDLVRTTFGQADLDALDGLSGAEYEDGLRRLVRHTRMEAMVVTRNRKLVADAKVAFKATHGGHLTCEACGLEFSAKYGRRGDGFIEAHHRVPLSTLKGPTKVTIAALAMLCSNCHRMIHRMPCLSVPDFQATLR